MLPEALTTYDKGRQTKAHEQTGKKSFFILPLFCVVLLTPTPGMVFFCVVLMRRKKRKRKGRKRNTVLQSSGRDLSRRERIWTADPLVVSETLYQLSYAPFRRGQVANKRNAKLWESESPTAASLPYFETLKKAWEGKRKNRRDRKKRPKEENERRH